MMERFIDINKDSSSKMEQIELGSNGPKHRTTKGWLWSKLLIPLGWWERQRKV